MDATETVAAREFSQTDSRICNNQKGEKRTLGALCGGIKKQIDLDR